jgi:uncharacterized Zn finger protein
MNEDKILPESHFNVDIINDHIGGSSSFNIGQNLVAAGELSELKFVAPDSFTALVHSAVNCSQTYETSVQFDLGNHKFESKCSCAGRAARHHRCKHQSALLHLLYALKNAPKNEQQPKWGKRKGMSRFKLPNTPMREKVRYHQTWEDALAAASNPTPLHNG